MNEANIMFVIGHLFCAGLFAAIGAFIAKGTLKRNSFIGVRTKKALSSDENWKKLNVYGGKRLMFWSAILAAIAVASFFIPLGAEDKPNLVVILTLACAPGLVIIPLLFEISIFSKKLD
jgi:uncharacterized membrane protein